MNVSIPSVICSFLKEKKHMRNMRCSYFIRLELNIESQTNLVERVQIPRNPNEGGSLRDPLKVV